MTTHRPNHLTAPAIAFAITATLLGASPAPAGPAAIEGVWSSVVAENTATPIDVSIAHDARGWRATKGAVVRRPTADTADYLDFPFADGTLRLSPTPAAAPRAYWIQPKLTPDIDYPFVTPMTLTQAGKGRWRAAAMPLARNTDLHLSISASADGAKQAFIRESGRNYGGGRRFRVTLTANEVTLVDQRDETQILRGTVHGNRLDLAIPQLGRVIPLRRPAASAVRFWARPPAEPQYRYRAPRDRGDGWPVAAAMAVGVAPAPLEALVRHIAAEQPAPSSPAIHSVMVAHRGTLVLEEYFHGFDGEPHDVRSAGKTLTTTIVGAAIGQGVAITPDAPVYPAFARRYPGLTPDPLAARLTLGDLMSMRSGYACDDDDPAMPGNEDVISETGGDIDARILRLPSVTPAGEGFAVYCSIDIHLAGAMTAMVAGRWLPDMFDRWIARPLDFRDYHWNLTPTGEGYGGGGAYVRPRDLLKIGQLHLSGGIWNGRRVLPATWVSEATRQLTVYAPPPPVGSQPPNAGDVHGYGYGWHRYLLETETRRYEAYAATGNGGQLVVVVPSLDLVVGFSGGSYNAYRTWVQWMKILIPKYIIPAVPVVAMPPTQTPG